MTDQNQIIKIAAVNYPGALQSAVYGFQEMFSLANNLCKEQKIKQRFSLDVLRVDDIIRIPEKYNCTTGKSPYKAIILPPSIGSSFCSNPDQQLKDWLLLHHSSGAVICSVCAGAFILASTGLLQKRPATTHWGLASQFSQKFPEVITDCEKLLINDGDLITTGGLMAWVNLGMELIAQFSSSSVMRQLGKLLLIDSGPREQRYYQIFSPKLDHGSKDILKAQHFMQSNFSTPISVTMLSDLCCLSVRTFLRRFTRSTGLTPIQYLQKLRVQKACDLMETADFSFDEISQKVGYEDCSAFRKVFVKIIGLTMKDYKKRFVNK
ncbi:MAG: helix-turn-helix domain-containing protein [Candidatus Riflebacteria bacterium]|nr:helix-turn-helix domain-containing protein [Candidatus Riflebacteria bacterium]